MKNTEPMDALASPLLPQQGGQQTDAMPELPEPKAIGVWGETKPSSFSADQMREYGSLCRSAVLLQVGEAKPVTELTPRQSGDICGSCYTWSDCLKDKECNHHGYKIKSVPVAQALPVVAENDYADLYRWLREDRLINEPISYPTFPWVVRCELAPWPTSMRLTGSDLDSAIRAAMQGEKP